MPIKYSKWTKVINPLFWCVSGKLTKLMGSVWGNCFGAIKRGKIIGRMVWEMVGKLSGKLYSLEQFGKTAKIQKNTIKITGKR